MIASLPMYDRPELHDAFDRLWTAVRTELGEGPECLVRGGDVWADWQSPDLLLSQTCGLPYRAKLHEKVSLVGTPDHGLEHANSGFYCSVFIARRDDDRQSPEDFADARLAYNEVLSQSGWAAPSAYADKHGFTLDRVVHCGSHRASAKAVAEHRADFAALDAVSWHMIQRYDDFASKLDKIGQTEPTPALPYITAPSGNPERILDALRNALASLSESDRDKLCLQSVVKIPKQAYLDMPIPSAPLA